MKGQPIVKDKERSGYYGLRLWLMMRDTPAPVWRVYWWFQPLRCRLGFHNWYDVLAGEASQCTCGKFGPHSPSIMQEYRWRPWLREWASKVKDAEFRARMWEGQYWRERGLKVSETPEGRLLLED